MEVSGVNNYQAAPQASEKPAEKLPAPSTGTAETEIKDVYEKSGTGKENYKIDSKAVKAAIEEATGQGARMRSLVEKLLMRQGNSDLKAKGFQFTKDFFEKLEVDEATKLQAQQDISEDGYYGVKQTSERILDFAKALAGGDPSKIDMLRDAMEKGFKEAERMWGDKLPEISYQTLEAVRKGFDEWTASFAGE